MHQRDSQARALDPPRPEAWSIDAVIYTYLLGSYRTDVYRSILPGRQDADPSLSLYWWKGRIWWMDYGKKGGTSKKRYGMSDSLLYIVTGKRFEEVDFSEVYVNPNEATKPQQNYPTVVTGEVWEGFELDYWNQYEQTVEDCEREWVAPLRELYYVEDRVTKSVPGDPAFVFNFSRTEFSKKVYRPYQDKINKWKSWNIRDVVEGWHSLPESGDDLYCVSSTKDRMCHRKIDKYGLNSPTEASVGPLLNWIGCNRGRFKRFFALGDDDEAGREFNRMLYVESLGLVKPLKYPKMPYHRELMREAKDIGEVFEIGGSILWRNVFSNCKTYIP